MKQTNLNINKSDFEQKKCSFLPKVVDQKDFFRVARDGSQDERMRLLAVGRIDRQSFLLLLTFFGDTVIRMVAISRLKSVFALNLVARLSKDYHVCRAAFDRIVALKIVKMNMNPI